MEKYYAIVFILILIAFTVIERKIISNWGMKQIDKSSGVEFERFLKLKFQSMGYRVRHTGKSGDYGADLILYKNKEKIVVQAKRYRGYVGQDAVREAVSAIAFYKATRAIVVTNSTFTDAAKRLAKSNHVELYDREWVKKVAGKGEISFREEEAPTVEGRCIQLCYKREISADFPFDAKELSHLIDEYLCDAGYTIKAIE